MPPLNALRAFEAAARHGGFTGAADELCVTRGAISRHVKVLEEHLGVALFRRLPQGIELTEAGRKFLPTLTDAFESISLRARMISSEKSDLRIICPPTISIRWLIPRLDQFRVRCPDIQIRLTTAFFEWDDFQRGDFDLGFGSDEPKRRPHGIEALPMFPMIVVPACAPALLAGPYSLERPRDLANFTLLHEHPDRHDWTAWLAAFDVEGVDPQAGEVFPNLDMAVKAAVMGEGVVMGDLVLTREEFETGQLVMPFEELMCDTDLGDFCLVGPSSAWGEPKVETFKTWISEAASVEAASLSLQKWSRWTDDRVSDAGR
ncbi:MAG: LysR substrate-binding domain-containing protein [Rhodospirillales bacterium]|nr:LysR substrate-binding domain-containing protein [Rhodospirillales bacterium]